MQVFILGGTGFLGYHATLELIQQGHTVRSLALPPKPAEDILPPGVELLFGDFNQLTDAKLIEMMNGCDAVVFAAGLDDRVTPKAPAYPVFFQANGAASVRFFRLAKKAGVARAVLLGSYFAHFDRQWPEMNLSAHHLYIRSRVEQESEVLKLSEATFNVMIFELSYIFGAISGRTPLWKPLVTYLHWPIPWVFYPRGGSAMISIDHVAEAITGALEHGKGGSRYLIGDENLTWRDFLLKMAAAAGLKKKVITLPDSLVRVGLFFIAICHRLRGREGGLSPVPFVNLQTREAFFDPTTAQRELGFSGGGLDEAFRATIRGCGF